MEEKKSDLHALGYELISDEPCWYCNEGRQRVWGKGLDDETAEIIQELCPCHNHLFHTVEEVIQ